MARTIRFHLDECCDPAIADGLRRPNIDVTTTHEAGLIVKSKQLMGLLQTAWS